MMFVCVGGEGILFLYRILLIFLERRRYRHETTVGKRDVNLNSNFRISNKFDSYLDICRSTNIFFGSLPQRIFRKGKHDLYSNKISALDSSRNTDNRCVSHDGQCPVSPIYMKPDNFPDRPRQVKPSAHAHLLRRSWDDLNVFILCTRLAQVSEAKYLLVR